MVKQKTCFVLEGDKEILAYGVIHQQFFAHGFIELLMVNNQYRRQGLGLSLINQLKKQSKTQKVFTSTNQSNIATQKVFTSTNQSNIATQQLLLKAGFIPSGNIENLDNNDPELIYCYIPD